MKSKNVIKFRSRYPNVWSKITEVDKKLWRYDTNSQFMRVGFGKDGSDRIEFVDPEGGPLIGVGSVIEKKYTIESIFRDKTTNKLMFKMK